MTWTRAKIAACGLIAAALMTNGTLAESADSAGMDDDAAQVQDLLFCAPRRPFLIRLHLSVSGKGFRGLRQQWADAQFAALDADGNGFLEGDELKRLPTAESLQPGLTVESAKYLQPDSDPADGKVSLLECRRYLLAATATPFSFQNQANNDVQVNLFPKLDADQDGKLSGEEIAAAAARLRRYDRNEDDVINVGELQQALPEEQAATQQRLAGVLRSLSIVDPSDQGLATSRRLLESYDKSSRDPVAKAFRKDERLSKSELLIEADAFDRADRNHDGKLDRVELGRLSAVMTPCVELAIEAPAAAGEFSVKSLRANDPAHAAVIRVQQESGGRWLLVLNETAFSLSAAGPPVNQEQQLRTTYLSQFKNLDQDKNDYLDRPEMQRFGFQDAFFLQADADGDGKLFEKEYETHVDRELELSKTSFALEVSGDGRSLFRLIDTSPADGRLSLRELADAPAKLLKWDANGDGDITLTELSIALNAVFRAGTPRINGPFGQPVENFNMRTPRQAGAGNDFPSWFVKMDRNGDGDLSPKEFLGRRSLFDKIDQDRDGLISADEAVAAHREAVAPPPP